MKRKPTPKNSDWNISFWFVGPMAVDCRGDCGDWIPGPGFD